MSFITTFGKSVEVGREVKIRIASYTDKYLGKGDSM